MSSAAWKSPFMPTWAPPGQSVSCSLHSFLVVLHESQHLGMLCLPPSVPQLTCLPFLPVTRFFPDLCMGLVNAHTKGQEYPRIPSQSFRGPCKTTSAAFCAKESLKGHQIAEEPHREST